MDKAHRKSTIDPRIVEIANGTALWYHTGKVPVTVCWVLVHDPQGEFSPVSLLCTDTGVEFLRVHPK